MLGVELGTKPCLGNRPRHKTWIYKKSSAQNPLNSAQNPIWIQQDFQVSVASTPPWIISLTVLRLMLEARWCLQKAQSGQAAEVAVGNPKPRRGPPTSYQPYLPGPSTCPTWPFSTSGWFFEVWSKQTFFIPGKSWINKRPKTCSTNWQPHSWFERRPSAYQRNDNVTSHELCMDQFLERKLSNQAGGHLIRFETLGMWTTWVQCSHYFLPASKPISLCWLPANAGTCCWLLPVVRCHICRWPCSVRNPVISTSLLNESCPAVCKFHQVSCLGLKLLRFYQPTACFKMICRRYIKASDAGVLGAVQIRAHHLPHRADFGLRGTADHDTLT